MPPARAAVATVLIKTALLEGDDQIDQSESRPEEDPPADMT